MSESFASGLFFHRVQSLPYENAVQGTALSSLIKRLLTVQWWEVRELSLSQKKKAQCSGFMFMLRLESGLELSQFCETSLCVMKAAAAEQW